MSTRVKLQEWRLQALLPLEEVLWHRRSVRAFAQRSLTLQQTAQVLWAAVVAEQLGFERAEALTLGRVVAGLNAYAKGVALGLLRPTPPEVKEQRRRLRAEESCPAGLAELTSRSASTCP